MDAFENPGALPSYIALFDKTGRIGTLIRSRYSANPLASALARLSI